jgi:uncharacterized protein (TIGR02270 family)
VSANVAASGPFPEIVEENLDEAAFLWGRWESELGSLTRNLDEVWSWTEDRMNGAIDGVLVARDPLFGRLIDRALSVKDLLFHTLAAHLLTVAPDPAARQRLAQLLCEAEDGSLAAMLRGIEVSHLDGTFSIVTRALLKKSPQHCAALARIKSFQRAALGSELATAFEADGIAEQVTAMRAAAFLPEPTVTAWVDRGLAHSSPVVRIAAIESGIRQRQRPAWDAARELVAAREAGSGGLLRLLAMFGKVADHAVVHDALSDAGSARAAFWALGHVGTREAAEHCLAAMQDQVLARLAGEAYAAITGIDLARERLTAKEPADAPSLPPFEEDNLDADLVPRREELWPLPDAALCAAHWAKIGAEYAPNIRYVRGKPFDLGVLMAAIDKGPMLRRGDYALELYVRTNGACDVETRAAGFTQRRMIAAAHAKLAAMGH